MLFFVLLIIIEILTFFALKDSLRSLSRGIFYIAVIIHGIISFCLWMILVETVTYKSFFDNAEHISLLMNLTGIICAVVFPRFIIILFHYTGKLFRIRRGGYIKWLTNTGFTTAIFIFSVIAFATFYGRFNFRTENVEIKIKDLNNDLEGWTHSWHADGYIYKKVQMEPFKIFLPALERSFQTGKSVSVCKSRARNAGNSFQDMDAS